MTTPPRDAAALAPCPFCGNPADIHNDGETWYARCQACGIGYQRVPKAAAIAAWNRRAPLPMSGDEWLEKAARALDIELGKINGSLAAIMGREDSSKVNFSQLRYNLTLAKESYENAIDTIRALKTTPTHGEKTG